MELTIKYNQHASHAIQGAFLRGPSPAVWLREMDSWNMPLESLLCFILTENNQPQQVAGLFVIFEKTFTATSLLITHPYRALGNKLFIPAQADLLPQISERELPSLLIWDYQVFHPALGFIGFEKQDRIPISELLQYEPPATTSWNLAQPGIEPWAKLRSISIEQPSFNDIFEDMKGMVNSKPLTDIPKTKDDSDSQAQDLLGKIRSLGIAGGLSVVGGLAGLLGALGGAGGIIGGFGGSGEGIGGSGGGGSSSRPGLLSRLSQWLDKKWEDLQKQRDNELNRLSKLFDTNLDEALQFAIPLGDKYYNRGTAAPSGTLTRRSTSFNPGALGGGQAVDGWEMDNYYAELREKYLRAADIAIANGDYKKAAYVYAHLLADYSAAANALKQGKHYREAALLYKDHLNSVPNAAACLEEGGLYQEAIDLYISINQHEKAGDLYTTLDQKDEALACYEECVQKAAINKDYLEQARIVEDKIHDVPRAQDLLLQGWQDVKQSEQCLTKYFDLAAYNDVTGAALPLHQQVQTIYNNTGSSGKKVSLLHVLDKVNKRYAGVDMNNTCRNIAYEVASEQAAEGKTNHLLLLKDFVDNDRLLTPDCNRFIHSAKNTPVPTPVRKEFQLLNDGIKWRRVTLWRNELLIWGASPTSLHLARMNWAGHTVYYSWNYQDGYNPAFLPVTDGGSSNKIMVYAPAVTMNDTLLAADHHFNNELEVIPLTWIQSAILSMAWIKEELVVLHIEKNMLFLNRYRGESLQLSHRLHSNNEPFIYEGSITERQELIHYNGFFYQPYEKSILSIAPDGNVEQLQVGSDIKKVTSAIINDCLYMAIYTDEGCRLIYSQSGKWHSLGNFFARETGTISDLLFLSDKYLVIAFTHFVQVYELNKSSAPVKIRDFVTKFWILALCPAGTRNHFAALGSLNRVKLYDIEDE